MEMKKKCPYCGEEILAVAKKCKHCGEWLDKNEKVSTPVEPLRATETRTGLKIWKIVIPLIILAMIIGGYLVISNHQNSSDKEAVAEKSDPIINFAEPDDGEENAYQDKRKNTHSQTEQKHIEDMPNQDIDHAPTEGNDSEELLSIGERYEKGIGVEENHETAFYYYEKAARSGNPTALNKLGNMYAQGKGCTKDASKAANYYLSAAQKGNKYAQHNIAFCYWDGVGVEKDRKKAVMWMRRSAAQGYEKAKKALKTMGVE